MHNLANIYFRFGWWSVVKYAIYSPFLPAKFKTKMNLYFVEVLLNGGENSEIGAKYHDIVRILA